MTSEMRFAVAVGIILVAFLCFTMGLLMRRASDRDLIEELEKELDARCAAPPEELRPQLAGDGARSVLEAAGELVRQPEGFIAVPDWHADETQVDDLEEWVRLRGRDLDQYVQHLIAAGR